jgi:hypothetical protein
MSDVLVFQSHRAPLACAWMAQCLDSVRAWARHYGMTYRYLGDELFDLLPTDLRLKTQNQLVIAADLARLLVIREAFAEGFATVIWCDADLLVFDPDHLILAPSSFALGREVWVQEHGGRPRAYVKVHNAFLMLRRPNPFLDYYLHAAQQLVREHAGMMAPQFVGPKLLSALHNVAKFPVQERAGMLNPLVMNDLLRGGGPSLVLFLVRSPEPPAALNLCGSLVATGETNDADVEKVLRLLLGHEAF